MPKELRFDPFPLFTSNHQQTVIGSVFNMQKQPPSKTRFISMPDGDKIALEVSTPKKWKRSDVTVMMIHGLCGSHYSPYQTRMTKKFMKKGIRAIRMNLRGCGSGKGFAKHLYHGGQSSDLYYVLKSLKEQDPDSKIILIGFSLGGSLALKLMGELQFNAKHFVEKVIAVNSPVNLQSSADKITLPENKFYEDYFIKCLREDVLYRHEIYDDLPDVVIPENLTFQQFDELYTAPRFGFLDASDYYENSSAKHFIPDIMVPCNILWSRDDPLIQVYDFPENQLPSNVNIFITQKGGHMGYLGWPRKKQWFYWMDMVLLNWVNEAL